MNHWKLAHLFILLVTTPVIAQEPPKPILAIIPDVQTAEWAKRWWMPRHEEKLRVKAEMKDVDLLLIGDSITHGFESGGKAMWDKYYAPRKALNLGFSGDRTENVLWRLQHGAVEEISPKLAVIMIGTNNTGHRQDPPKETSAGIQAIVGELKKQLPDTKILLLAIFPRGEKPNDRLRKINDGINEIVAGYADGEKVFFLDINDKFLTQDGTLPKSIMPDLLHPNDKGYAIWAETIEPTIAKLMGESSAE